MNKFIASLALIATSVTFSASAYAAPTKEVNGSLTTEVKIADLNLSSIAGQTALASRIRQAATLVCSPFNSRDRMAPRANYKNCVKLAVANATAASQPKIAAALSHQTKIAAR